MVHKEGERNSMISENQAGNGTKVPPLTKKEAKDLGHLFPADVQQRIAEAAAKI